VLSEPCDGLVETESDDEIATGEEVETSSWIELVRAVESGGGGSVSSDGDASMVDTADAAAGDADSVGVKVETEGAEVTAEVSKLVSLADWDAEEIVIDEGETLLGEVVSFWVARVAKPFPEVSAGANSMPNITSSDGPVPVSAPADVGMNGSGGAASTASAW
jgi:hypothetical protein